MVLAQHSKHMLKLMDDKVRHCRQMRRNNKFGAKNMNLAATIGERKITGRNFLSGVRMSPTSGLKSLPRAA